MNKQHHTVLVRTLCFIFNAKNQLLLIERGPEKFDAGMHNALGGHVEKGEDIIESANREIFEESGITPISTQLAGIIHVSDFFSKNILMFITKSMTDQTEVKDSEEGRLIWINIADLDKHNIYADVKPFIKKLENSNKMFTGTSRFDGKGELLELTIKDLENE